MKIEDLQTLAQQQATPRALRKDQLPTKLDRAIDHKAFRLEDAKKLRIWAREVKALDHWTDRKTGKRVLKTLSLDADRAESHHVEGKDDWNVRYDVRNGLCVSLAIHEAVTRGQYRIDGTVWFTVKGQRYINARFPVIFVRV
jgi:hypothetical protein